MDRTNASYLAGLRRLMLYLTEVDSPSELDYVVAQWVELVWEDGIECREQRLHFFEHSPHGGSWNGRRVRRR